MIEARWQTPTHVRKVVLLEPKSEVVNIYSRFGLPRLGVVLLGTILRDLGYEVRVFVEEKKPFERRDVFDADLIGISSITPTAVSGYRWADEARARGIPVVLGGPHPTHCCDEAMKHADFVVRGEGEVALPELIEAMKRGSGFEEVAGLSFHGEDTAHHVPIAPLERDLDRFPDPDISLVDGHEAPSLLGTKRIIPIQTSRGCPHDCSFCTVTGTFGRRMRYRSVDRVVKELSRYDPKTTHVFIYDDNFAANKRRTRELLEAFRSVPGGVPAWSAQVRADVARDEQLLDEIRAAGCDVFYIGLESVNDATLSSTHKRQSLEEVSTYLERITRRGISVHGMFVFGFDTDEPGTMERTVEFARAQGLFSVQFLILTPLPGSRLTKELEEEGRVLHHDWALYDTHHVCFQPARVTPFELQTWQTRGHRQFYSPLQIAKRIVGRQWHAAAVSAYAANQARKWDRQNLDYMKSLSS
jgi:radical SAM superfamily enzyme YgiQ (UPF0313 family)